VAEVIERSFDVHLEKLERRKFGVGARSARSAARRP
jgi:hypothetical protein